MTEPKKIIAAIVILLILVGIGILQLIRSKQSINLASDLQENTFYLAKYKNMPVLFYKFEGMMIMSGDSNTSDMGQYIPYEKFYDSHKTSSQTYISFQKLQNPRKLFSFEKYASIENIQLNNDNTYLTMSFIGGNMDSTNYIYQVNLKTLESKNIWEHEIRTGNSPYNGGVAYITQFFPDRYVIFAIVKGNPPTSDLPVGVIIKNTQSGNEKVLGVAGDTQVDLKNNIVSYRILSKTKMPCEGNSDPACFTGDKYKNVPVPTGEVFKQTF